MNILWTHLNSGGGAIFVDKGYNSMDVSVFSFGKKTNYFTVFVYVEVVNSLGLVTHEYHEN